MHRALAIWLTFGCALMVGCGGSGQRASVPNGADVFSGQCSSCHSLVGNESQHKQGGDLLGYSLSRTALVQFAAEMPTPRPLDAAELKAVVEYVLRAEQASR